MFDDFDIELMPCPFCGKSKPIVMVDFDDDSSCFIIVCNYLKGGCGASSIYSDDFLECQAAWNKRVIS